MCVRVDEYQLRSVEERNKKASKGEHINLNSNKAIKSKVQYPDEHTPYIFHCIILISYCSLLISDPAPTCSST